MENTPVREAFPWLGAVTCYSKQAKVEEGGDLEAPLVDGAKPKTIMIGGKEVVKRAPKAKKNPIGESATDANPLAKLGFGIVAYVDMLWCLIWTFTLYTIFLIPTFMYFGEGKAYDAVPAALKSDYLDTYLGNMGYSSVQCAQIPYSVQRLSLSCPYGNIGEFLDFGVTPRADNKDLCKNTAENSMCSPTADIQSSLEASIGEPSFLWDYTNKPLWTSGDHSDCTTTEATVFVQYTCIQDQATQEAKYD